MLAGLVVPHVASQTRVAVQLTRLVASVHGVPKPGAGLLFPSEAC